jgi:hypothetical protein
LFIWFCTIFIAENMNWMGHKLLHFVSIFNSQPCLIPLSEPEPEPHRVTASAPTKRCGSGRCSFSLYGSQMTGPSSFKAAHLIYLSNLLVVKVYGPLKQRLSKQLRVIRENLFSVNFEKGKYRIFLLQPFSCIQF